MCPGEGFFVFPDTLNGSEGRKSPSREGFLAVRQGSWAIDEIGSCAYDRKPYRSHRIIPYICANKKRVFRAWLPVNNKTEPSIRCQ
jgi:hypothetical protein